ncbi:MAG TPA: redoxin domain-containing protein [Bacteroidia bacterium]|nr:redoxin domain-containing protein [Bacteroidia bacterium]
MLDIRFKILLTISIVILTMSFSDYKKTESKKATVYIFLSETCPICQSYTLTLKELYKKYNSKIEFVGVFPNYYADLDSIVSFKEKYAIPFELITDTDAKLTKHFKASITPEVFVENAGGKLLYSGRIDDSFYAIGKRRNVITATELSDALIQIVSGHPVAVPKTQAVGCIISISK